MALIRQGVALNPAFSFGVALLLVSFSFRLVSVETRDYPLFVWLKDIPRRDKNRHSLLEWPLARDKHDLFFWG